MKNVFFLIIASVFLCCKSPTPKIEPELRDPITITSGEIKEMVSYLASDDLKGRATGTSGIDSAATFIENQFKTFGVKPYFETFRDTFKVKDSINAFNIVGFLEGNDKTLKNEVVLIGAHYDHIGFGKTVETDSIANGANDNATGTAAVMAMAKYFAAKKNNKRSLVFVLFSAEEMGLLGSRHLAEKLKNENLNLYTVVNFEMIGVPLKTEEYKAFVTGFETSNFSDKVNNYAGKNVVGFSEVSKKYRLFLRSDNYPFYRVFNVPSHTISSCDLTNFDYYHQVGDESDLMDFEFMSGLINQLIPAVEAMSTTAKKEIQLNTTKADG